MFLCYDTSPHIRPGHTINCHVMLQDRLSCIMTWQCHATYASYATHASYARLHIYPLHSNAQPPSPCLRAPRPRTRQSGEGTRTGRAPACPKSQLFTGAELLTNPRRRSRPPGRRSPGRYLWLLLITQLSAVAAQRRMIKYYPHRLSSRSTAAAHRRRRSRHRPTCSHLASPAPGRWVWQAARRSVFVEGLTD